MTGRGTSAQWHTNTRTGKSAVLRTLYPADAFVEVNPNDARAVGIIEGAMVEIASRRGAASVRALLTDTVAPGQLFMPMHYAETNRLTFAAFDPYSRQPSYKASAVSLKPVSDSRAPARHTISAKC
jgi:assimilatory nitrate reductase catalytic subunit